MEEEDVIADQGKSTVQVEEGSDHDFDGEDDRRRKGIR